jgi:hypothetical protein
MEMCKVYYFEDITSVILNCQIMLNNRFLTIMELAAIIAAIHWKPVCAYVLIAAN